MRKLLLLLLFTCTVSGAVFMNSFNSGQMSKKTKLRLDLEKRQMGVEVLENMLIRPQGMAYRRPGTEMIDDCNDVNDTNIRLIPFEYSTDDSYVIELGHEEMGFFRTTE